VKGLAGAAFLLIGALSSREAVAFCRSTTCDPGTTTCTPDQNGCPGIGTPLTWRELPLTYRFQKTGSEKLDNEAARESVREAFSVWSNVKCGGKRTSLRFKEGPEIRSAKPKGKKQKASEPFGIYFRDDGWPYDDGDESLAITNQTFGLINGYIDYSDIEINTTDRTFAIAAEEEGIDLQSVVTHEIGHYIGLAHSQVQDSIMVARYCQSGDRCGKSVEKARALADDDIDAVCAMYPPGGKSGVAYEPLDPSSCSASPLSGRASGTLAGSAVILGITVLVARRRRRTPA